MSLLVSSLPISNMGLYLDNDQQKGSPRPEGSRPHPAIIIASLAHSNFFSQVRHRPKSDYISTRDSREPPKIFGINFWLKVLPWLTAYRPFRLGHDCGCVLPTGLLFCHDPVHSGGRTTPQSPYITPHTQVTDRLLPAWHQVCGLGWGFQACLWVPPGQLSKATHVRPDPSQQPWTLILTEMFPEVTAAAQGTKQSHIYSHVSWEWAPLSC